MDSETQFFWHPWPASLRPDLVSAASQVSFLVLFCFSSGASEPSLSQTTHFSFAAETGGWSFLSPSPEAGSDCALRRSSREWDYIVDILSSLGIFETMKTTLLLPWNPRRPQRGMTFLFEIFWAYMMWHLTFFTPVRLKQRTEVILRPGPFIASHQASLRLQLCCLRRIYSIRGAVSLPLGNKVPSSGVGLIPS